MRKGIVAAIIAVLAVAAAVSLFSLSTPVLKEDTEYELTSLYHRGQEISDQVDGDDIVDLLRDASRGLLSRGGLPAHSFADTVEVDLQGEDRTLHVVLSSGEGLFVVYEDADWCYSLRDGEALAQAVEELLPQ